MPATMPMTTAPVAVMKPVAGVTTTRPATAPEQKPRTVGLPVRSHSTIGQTKEAMPVARVVVMNACAATPSAATAEPALNPYQPTQSMPVPMAVRTRLWGAKFCFPHPLRLPRMIISTRADQPELMWTTVPPAKSIDLMEAAAFQTPFIIPVAPQTMCARGK